MTDKEIVERAKKAEKRTGFGELVHSPISKGVNSAFGIGFIEGMVEYRNSLQEEHVVPKVLEDMLNAKTAAESLGISTEEHDKIIDLCLYGEKPVSEDLEQASKEWLRPQLDKSYANYGEVKMMELTRFDGYAMLDAIEFGAKWGKNQAKVEIQAQSMALAHGCPKKHVIGELEKEIDDAFLENKCNITDNVSLAEFVRIAKHFFELGKNAIKKCDFETLT